MMSTLLRTTMLSLLRRLPIRHFAARSGIGLPFVCHLGDSLGEMPFYNCSTDIVEITAIAEWCRGTQAPLILDVGANTGFLSSQVVQLLRDEHARCYCFEPVPETFQKLLTTIRVLGLSNRMLPVCAAVSDSVRLAEIAYDSWDSMLAQLVHRGTTTRVGRERAWCATLTVDLVSDTVGHVPALLKIDVEGSELAVLQGAKRTLESADRPALCLEYNPQTLSECGVSSRELMDVLNGYRLFFLDDFEHHHHRLGTEITDVRVLTTPTNLFCVPDNESALQQWDAVLQSVARSLGFESGAALERNGINRSQFGTFPEVQGRRTTYQH